MTDYLDLQSRINDSYNRLDIDPPPKKSGIDVDKKKYDLVSSDKNINDNVKHEELINFCNNYYSCFDKEAQLCKDKTQSSNKIVGYSLYDTSILDLQYDDLLQQIERLQKSMNSVDNIQISRLSALYKKYELAEIDLTNQTNDNMFIDTKNEIIQTKYNYELNKMKIYALLIIISTMINIWFYITFLQNKL